MQAGESDFRLRFPSGDEQYPGARRSCPVGHVRQERGLAHASLTDDDQDAVRLRDRIHQSAQPGKGGSPANDLSRLL
jgi:hypothetical protein